MSVEMSVDVSVVPVDLSVGVSVDMSVVSVDLSVDVSLQLSQDEVLSVALVGRPIICTNCRNLSSDEATGAAPLYTILSSSVLLCFLSSNENREWFQQSEDKITLVIVLWYTILNYKT